MGRAILPELAIALVVLVLCGLVLVGIGVAQWSAGLAITDWFTRNRQRKVAQRERAARDAARWESRTRYQRGFAVIDVVRIARWDGCEKIVESNDQLDSAIIPEEDAEKIAMVQLEADIQADQRNRQL